MRFGILILSGLMSLVATTAVGAARSGNEGEWIPRLSCGSDLEVDGLHTFENGFDRHQVVIRNAETIRHFESLIGTKLELNERSELVVPLYTQKFESSFDANVIDVKPSPDASSGVFYSVHGHWNGANYQVDLSQFSHYPGMTYHEAEKIGDWSFKSCVQLK